MWDHPCGNAVSSGNNVALVTCRADALHPLPWTSSEISCAKSEGLGLWDSCSLDPATFSSELVAFCLSKYHKILPLVQISKPGRWDQMHTTRAHVNKVGWACWYVCSHCAYNHCCIRFQRLTWRARTPGQGWHSSSSWLQRGTRRNGISGSGGIRR